MRLMIARSLLGVVLVVLLTAISASPAAADTTGEEVGYGGGSVFTTLVYAPFKATFCILGAITSGFTLPFAGTQTAGKVATAACGGTWAITPSVLKGQERVRFVGGSSSGSEAAAKGPTMRK
jgi:hypothetical protein